MPMKIALVSEGFLPHQGGVEYVVHHLGNHWARMGHEILVVNAVTATVWHPEGRYAVTQYHLLRGTTRFGYHRQPWLAAATRSVSAALHKFNPAVVSGHTAVPVALYLANAPTTAPWALTAHGSDVVTGDPHSMVDRYQCDDQLHVALQKASAVVAISRVAEESLGRFSLKPGIVNRISNGVEVKRFSDRLPGNARVTLGMPADSEFLLTVARNHPVKNLSLGLRAFARWNKRPRNLYYVFVGQGATRLGPEAASLGVGENVRLVECLYGDDLVRTYQQATLLVSTSHREFCPLVILEAMAAGLPQVATQVAGNEEFVADGQTGLLAEDDDASTLSVQIERLHSSPELRARLSQNCRTSAGQYDWSQIAQKYLALFEACLGKA